MPCRNHLLLQVIDLNKLVNAVECLLPFTRSNSFSCKNSITHPPPDLNALLVLARLKVLTDACADVQIKY